MHRALLVCEILLEIFKHVSHDPWTSTTRTRRFLAALAATCKTFYEPAMNELWAEIDGLNPQLGCVTRLHSKIYCEERTWRNPPHFGNIEPLSANEAHQFLLHAARVRSMHFESATIRNLRLLSVLPPNESMFPRLQAFRASYPCPSRYLHLFLSPTLRCCDLEATDLDLKLIVTRCPGLEDLSVVLADSTIANRVSVSDSIRLCKRLVTLYCRYLPLDWAAWEHLSNLSSLLTLATHMGNVVPSPSDLNRITLGPFLNLTTLLFKADTAACITTLIEHSEFPSLKQIDLYFKQLPLADAERLCHALSQCKACQTLEYIRIQSYGTEVWDTDSSWTASTQFCCCSQLRALQLEFPYCSANLDNDHLLEAMSCWPHIRFLALEDTSYREATITFRGLLTALRQCPLLTDLRLLIDMVNLDVDPTAESFRHTSLQLLDVRSAEVVDTEAVAHILFSMLPCVHKIRNSPIDFGRADAWRKVRNHLDHLKSSAVP
ncbi:hypothetical protein EDD22DRAFT_362802 [Suillus occidentalis]|nr:hypothetical protein EDD22DRAFT_362802 [Suillus occidentalis]